MPIAFDPAKDAANIAKHGVSLADADGFDFASAVIVEDVRHSCGETRFPTFSRVGAGASASSSRSSQRPSSARSATVAITKRKYAAMASEPEPDLTDLENPEWAEEVFAWARPVAEVLPPALCEALTKRRGRPPLEKTKTAISLRVDPDVLEAFKAGGPGWQGRINAALRDAASKL